MVITIWGRLACLLIGYAFGCFQSAFVVGKLILKTDIREHGSGNSGTNNAIRVFGFKYGAMVFVLDVLKVVAAYLVPFIYCFVTGVGTVMTVADVRVVAVYTGLGVVLGHNFPLPLKFRGGKGIACTLGVALCLDWRVFLALGVLMLVIIAVTKYVSVASLTMAVLFPVTTFAMGYGAEVTAVAVGLTALAFVLHRGNVVRLVKGTERKFNAKGKGIASNDKNGEENGRKG